MGFGFTADLLCDVREVTHSLWALVFSPEERGSWPGWMSEG